MNRRRFLRGLGGVALGLPFLESLGRKAFAAPPEADKPARRLVVFFQCNGVNMNRFWPDSFGALGPESFGQDQALYPLRDYASRLLIPRGMHKVPKGFGWDGTDGCDHQNGMGGKLTAQPLEGGGPYAAGASVDQVIAKAVNPAGAPPLTLNVGSYSNSPTGYISYRGPNDPVGGETNPWLVYDELVGLTNADAQARARIIERRQSVIDLVSGELSALQARPLSTADRAKLDLHLTSVRDLERRMERNGFIPCALDPVQVQAMQDLDAGTVTYDHMFPIITEMQIELAALAVACCANRVVTLQLGSGAGGPIFTWDGMSHQYNQHKLSHGTTMDDGGEAVAGYEQMIHDIDRWHAKEFKYLLDKLDGYVEADGTTVLDNTAAVWANELSDGKDHDFRDLPWVIAGSCGGYFRQGEYVKVTGQDNPKNDVDAPHNKLLTMFMNAMGLTNEDGSPITYFGHPDFGQQGEYDELKA